MALPANIALLPSPRQGPQPAAARSRSAYVVAVGGRSAVFFARSASIWLNPAGFARPPSRPRSSSGARTRTGDRSTHEVRLSSRPVPLQSMALEALDRLPRSDNPILSELPTAGGSTSAAWADDTGSALRPRPAMSRCAISTTYVTPTPPSRFVRACSSSRSPAYRDSGCPDCRHGREEIELSLPRHHRGLTRVRFGTLLRVWSSRSYAGLRQFGTLIRSIAQNMRTARTSASTAKPIA